MPAMQRDDDEPGADALARRLASVHLGLAHASDEIELLAAVAAAVRPYAPIIADLHYLEIDAADVPIEARPIAVWTPDEGAREHPHRGHSYRLADTPLAEHWIATPDHPLIVRDVTTDPRCNDLLRALVAPRRAMAVLPLRSEHPARWQGMCSLHWAEPHAPGPEERLVYRLLMHSVAGFIADRRALAEHALALAEITALYRLSTRINEAADPEELLAAIVDETRIPGAQGKLLAVETDPAGQPQTLEIIAVYGGGPTAAASLGKRFDVTDSPTAHIWIEHPAAATMIGDLATDPRLDDAAHAIHLRHGLASVILLPLRWQGRWRGLLQLGWDAPRQFDDDDRRHYEGLAPHAAAVLDNRLLVARNARAIADNRSQARTLEIVLDHLPVGVMIIDAVTGKRSVNRAGVDLLTDEQPDVRQPLPLFHPDSDRAVTPEERLSRIAMRSGEVVSRERDLVAADGTRRRFSVTAAPFRDHHGAIAGSVSLFHDLTQQLRAEREREQLKAAVISAQRAALAERATPLIPISDEILVVPIIGAIDSERGRQLVETLMHLEGHDHVRIVLLDLTGVRDLDDAGARALVQAAAVLRLRGVTTILTGIGQDVAWTLIEENIDLRGLTTHATLRAGLAHAARL